MDSSLKDEILAALRVAWSVDSNPKWSEEKPAIGQCSVTALVVQEQFGGDILKTKVGDDWHFYNSFDSKPEDFTVEQFNEPSQYLDIRATRNEALEDTNSERYLHLSKAFKITLDELRKAV